MKWEPRIWQQHFLDEGLRRDALAAWIGMGLGKTSTAATIVQERMDRGQVARTLVFAPLRVCEQVWPVELAKWDHLCDLPIRFIRGTAKERSRQLLDDWWGIDLVNYDIMTWLFREHCRAHHRGGPLPWQMVVYDEASKLKAVGTQRFRALRRWSAMFDYVLELTGSPAPAGYLNLWTQAYLLDHGAALEVPGRRDNEGRTFTAFREHWFEQSDFMGWRYQLKGGARRDIEYRLEPLVLSMRTEDYLELPELTVNDIWCPLGAEARADYRELEREMFIRLEAGDVEAANAGVLTGKCRQVANGFLYTDGRVDQWHRYNTDKLDALQEIRDEMDGSPVLVFFQFKADLDSLRRRYKALVHTVDSPNVWNRWDRGEVPILALHPASAGHGLNLQAGSDTIVFLGCGHSFDQYEQAIDRIAGGMRRERPVTVHRILTMDTVDQDIIIALAEHCQVQDVLKRRLATRVAA